MRDIEGATEYIIELLKEIKQLRELMKKLVENAEGGEYGKAVVLNEDLVEIEKELGDK